MSIKKYILCSLLIASSQLVGAHSAHSSVVQLKVSKPVIGYLTDHNGSAILTINDRHVLTFKEVVEGLSPAQQAISIARELNELQLDSKLSPDALEAVMENNLFKIKIHNKTLLSVTKTMAEKYNKSDAALALDWVDNLRVALGAQPASLALNQSGQASWYGGKFHGRKTASGEIYNMHEMTAAHRFLPFGTRVLVTNQENQESVMVTINDRGPFVQGRIIDLSPAAFRRISKVGRGLLNVNLRVVR